LAVFIDVDLVGPGGDIDPPGCFPKVAGISSGEVASKITKDAILSS
jgi:hypothetical protein